MFYDYAKIYVKSGDGGNGIVAFRREKYVPMGGPSGGDGGRGGNVVFVGDEGLKTLIDFKYKRHYKANRGENGLNKNMYGAGADDLEIRVPLGTIVREAETGKLIADVTRHGQKIVVAKGGRGGRGNVKFVNRTHKAPEIAENGEPGSEHWLVLELKLLADVGIIGMPNAGKSTLISQISASRPKIADYAFTTIVPNLGVVFLGDGNSFVVADLPGLIEGAAEGAGLGHRFLRHVERTKVLLHVLDLSEYTEKEPWDAFALVNEELRLYKANLVDRPQIIAANKMDSPGAKEKLQELKKHLDQQYGADHFEIFPISALAGEGLQPLLWRLWQLIGQTQSTYEADKIESKIGSKIESTEERIGLPAEDLSSEDLKYTIVRPQEPWTIEKQEDGYWLVRGKGVEKLVAMTNLERDDSVRRLQKVFVKMGLEGALREAGVEEGDTVRIGEIEFDYSM